MNGQISLVAGSRVGRQPRRTAVRRFFALAFVLVAGAGAGRGAQHPIERVEPVVVIPATPFQLGSFRADETRTALFRIRNNAQDPIRISQVRAGCPCTVVASHTQTPFPQGTTGEVELKVIGRLLREGKFERTAFVELENSPTSSLVLRYEGTVICPFRVSPSRDVVLASVAGPDADWTRVFEMEGNFGAAQRVVLGDPVVTGPAKARLVARGPARYRLTVSPNQPPPGPLNVEVQIPVLEPRGLPPEVITLRGHIGLRLLVVPAMLDIPEGDTPLRRELRVSLAQAETFALRPEDFTVLAPAGVTATLTADRDAVRVSLLISPEGRRAGVAGVVEIGSKRAPAVRIPYYVLQPPRRVSDKVYRRRE